MALRCLRDDELRWLQLGGNWMTWLDQYKLLQVEVLLLLQLLQLLRHTHTEKRRKKQSTHSLGSMPGFSAKNKVFKLYILSKHYTAEMHASNL